MTWLQIARGLAVTDAKQIARDRFLTFTAVYSVVLAIAVRFGVPPLAEFLERRFEFDLTRGYPLLSSFFGLTLGASLIGLVLGFLLLEGRESRVAEALAVTPLTFDRFLTYRIAMPMLLAVGFNPLCAVIAGIGLPPPLPLFALSVAGSFVAGLSALSLATFADDKVQAFAVMKLVSSAGLLVIPPYFIDGPARWIFGLFPPFWLFEAWWVAAEGKASWWIHGLVGVVTNALFLLWMKRRFEEKLHRRS